MPATPLPGLALQRTKGLAKVDAQEPEHIGGGKNQRDRAEQKHAAETEPIGEPASGKSPEHMSGKDRGRHVGDAERHDARRGVSDDERLNAHPGEAIAQPGQRTGDDEHFEARRVEGRKRARERQRESQKCRNLPAGFVAQPSGECRGQERAKHLGGDRRRHGQFGRNAERLNRQACGIERHERKRKRPGEKKHEHERPRPNRYSSSFRPAARTSHIAFKKRLSSSAIKTSAMSSVTNFTENRCRLGGRNGAADVIRSAPAQRTDDIAF